MNPRLQWQRLAAAFDKRSQAEKAIIAVLVLAVIGWLYLMLAYDPMRAAIADARRQVDTLEARISSVRSRAEAARQASAENPNENARQRLQRLREQQQTVDRRIESMAGNLVSPGAMTGLLTSVLENLPGLDLVRVENRSPEPLRDLQEAATGDGEDSASGITLQQIYRHGLVLEFEGDFFATLRYLRFLEQRSGNFFWDSLELEQTEWPEARVTLEIHTLSTDEGFVGV